MFDKERIRKKKRLTDPVAILSFPNQPQKKEQLKKTIIKSENNDDVKPVSLHREAKKLSNPTGNLKSEILSIKELKQKLSNTNQNEREDLDDKPSNYFSYDDLKMAWRKFAYKAKEQGLDTLFAAITVRDPKLEDDYKLVHTVDNDVQKDFLIKNETNLLTFLRNELKNWKIELTCEVSKEENASKTLYSGQDKFKDMAQRNPHLKTLLQRFKLDIDF